MIKRVIGGALLYVPLLAHLCLFSAAAVAAHHLGHWPLPSIDDPKYEHILGAHPLLHDVAVCSALFLVSNIFCPIVPMLALAVFPIVTKRAPSPFGVAVCMVTTAVSAFDPGKMILWIMD